MFPVWLALWQSVVMGAALAELLILVARLPLLARWADRIASWFWWRSYERRMRRNRRW
ncbi:hypothetical protein LX15_001771 [Streptoalloteichus tenebrarius]|uniref:Uncharacterized protein n=1 Tax=Streptoalloteichus tenebrarius (strain ATCC 17920 / DSM 40477 / JCM 4838 / CBS 697.72 / NBRC 16177 / NCIMB 11028 / NRRL B-12390 / A12253. 1 / ISP 5477) TaxID=1933 RepID=A0ABT1HRD3_STRSD|nr:hypothetical protein [Streptoalloteichus tenebrarius]